MQEIDEALAILSQAKADKARAEKQITEATAILVKIAEREESKTIQGQYLDKTYSLTVVASERLVYDETGLRKALGEKQWRKITTEKIDASKLKEAMTSGTVDMLLVSQHTSLKKSSPYVRVSENDT